jgi:hypothetical protein
MREIRSVTDLDLRRNEETTEESLRRAPVKTTDIFRTCGPPRAAS